MTRRKRIAKTVHISTLSTRTGIPKIVRYGKTLKRHFDRINNKIKTAFKRLYEFVLDEYFDTMILPIAGKLEISALVH